MSPQVRQMRESGITKPGHSSNRSPPSLSLHARSLQSIRRTQRSIVAPPCDEQSIAYSTEALARASLSLSMTHCLLAQVDAVEGGELQVPECGRVRHPAASKGSMWLECTIKGDMQTHSVLRSVAGLPLLSFALWIRLASPAAISRYYLYFRAGVFSLNLPVYVYSTFLCLNV